jgi:hypothetical protein
MWRLVASAGMEHWQRDRCFGESPFFAFAVSDEYLKAAGEHARKRIIAAGIRLSVLLGAEPDEPQEVDTLVAEPTVPLFSSPTESESRPISRYWLNTKTNVRHKESCRWFGKTSAGRYCDADEGEPCGICGG